MRAVVFDMDGLMFNTEDVYTMVGEELLRRRGCLFTPELKHKIMGTHPRVAFETMIGCCNLTDTWETMALESNEIFLALITGRLQPMPGLMALLDALETAGLPKAICTSSCRQLVDACLGPFELAGRFQFILAAEDIVNGKPNPEIYLTAARRFNISPAEMAVLEDSENGCRAAAAAGAFTIAVPGEHSKSQNFAVASLVVESLADPKLYNGLGIVASGEWLVASGQWRVASGEWLPS